MVNDKSVDYKQKLEKLLLRRARGYPYTEKTDEYVVVDGEVTLAKRKVVTKRVQPDADALKLLMELDVDADVTQMTDEQLQTEKLRLIALLKSEEEAAQAEQKSIEDDSKRVTSERFERSYAGGKTQKSFVSHNKKSDTTTKTTAK